MMNSKPRNLNYVPRHFGPCCPIWSAGAWLLFCLFATASSRPAEADTPAQARQAIQQIYDRSAVFYQRRDLAGYMAMFASTYTAVGVTGIKVNYLETQAGVAREIAQKQMGTSQHTVQSLVVRGNQAQGIVTDHYIIHRLSHKPAYTYTRDIVDKVLWVKQPNGWHLVNMRLIRDALAYEGK